MYSIRDYVTASGGGADGMHAPMAGWFWWSWNANSGDTGGLVTSYSYTPDLAVQFGVFCIPSFVLKPLP